ncbi:phage holin family protein [Microvirga sp. STR05]|uniref:Phage holin family protein n=2 Tax=Hymenobacter TaxID=89966 RepID=A0A7G7W2U7_9BACT|nr:MULTISPECIES: phage holin family protein [Hymenobacter]MBD2717051.1 phage holin family protein [Hymenobacter duratus]MBR7951967.1 phage holin family protein [Microvirga sp. STR05]QNH60690.1 phage holin family protein [Hymenobacter sediminicola]
MVGFIVKFLLSAIITFVLAKFLPGSHIDGFGAAIMLVIVLAVLNAILKPILKLFGFPITVLTLGLFLLVINAVIVMIADYLIPGFKLDGFLSALLFSVVLSVVTSIVDMVVD